MVSLSPPPRPSCLEPFYLPCSPLRCGLVAAADAAEDLFRQRIWRFRWTPRICGLELVLEDQCLDLACERGHVFDADGPFIDVLMDSISCEANLDRPIRQRL